MLKVPLTHMALPLDLSESADEGMYTQTMEMTASQKQLGAQCAIFSQWPAKRVGFTDDWSRLNLQKAAGVTWFDELVLA